MKERLISQMPQCVCNSYRYSSNGLHIESVLPLQGFQENKFHTVHNRIPQRQRSHITDKTNVTVLHHIHTT